MRLLIVVGLLVLTAAITMAWVKRGYGLPRRVRYTVEFALAALAVILVVVFSGKLLGTFVAGVLFGTVFGSIVLRYPKKENKSHVRNEVISAWEDALFMGSLFGMISQVLEYTLSILS